MKIKITFICFAFVIAFNAQAQDVTFTTIPVSGGNGNIGVVDLNGDFLDDLFDPSNTNVLVQYQTETGFDLNNIAIAASNSPSWSVSAGDFDANGFNDLMFGGNNGVSFLKANDDGTAFTQSQDSNIWL